MSTQVESLKSELLSTDHPQNLNFKLSDNKT